jgi:succinate dehydrogenase flavin-adding protein (antitoxin of CptAB toxin-antitoxin module)
MSVELLHPPRDIDAGIVEPDIVPGSESKVVYNFYRDAVTRSQAHRLRTFADIINLIDEEIKQLSNHAGRGHNDAEKQMLHILHEIKHQHNLNQYAKDFRFLKALNIVLNYDIAEV